MCNQRGFIFITLHHLYSTHRDTLPCPPLDKSDHNSILLIPAYKQKLKQEAPVTRAIRKWSDEADAKLQNCFASTDWNMFWDFPMALKSTPHQSMHRWRRPHSNCTPPKCHGLKGNIHTELTGRASAFKKWDANPEAYKKSRYALQRNIKEAKRQYRTKKGLLTASTPKP